MYFKVTFRFNGESGWRHYKCFSLSSLFRELKKSDIQMIAVFEIKRLLRLPKDVECIEL